MSCCAYSPTGPHVTLGVTGSSAATAPFPAGTLRIVSKRNAHIALDEAATQAGHNYILADHPTFITIGEGQTLNAILATGETDGDMFISFVRQS